MSLDTDSFLETVRLLELLIKASFLYAVVVKHQLGVQETADAAKKIRDVFDILVKQTHMSEQEIHTLFNEYMNRRGALTRDVIRLLEEYPFPTHEIWPSTPLTPTQMEDCIG
jgi:hypothetical protein